MADREMTMVEKKPAKKSRAKPWHKPPVEPVVRTPQIRWQDVGYTVRCGHKWPEDAPLPTAYLKPRPMPCPQCKTVLLKTGARCCYVTSTPVPDAEGVSWAFFMCRECHNRWKVPVA